jgi:ubiquinone/menaquinone biosynthesis C-methylase UbiE
MKFAVPKGTFAKSASSGDGPALTRHSSGFDQFCTVLKGSGGLSVLDLSGASQANITFVTDAGHRISSDDIVGAMLQSFGDNFQESQQSEAKAKRFLDQALSFPPDSFDGVLVWDAFQFLAPPLINQTVDKLMRVVRPGGMILAFFNANEKIKEIPLYSYRIQDGKTLQQVRRGPPQNVQNFNNRMIEKLFESASSVKFFLTRDNLREVLVRR